MGRAAVRGPRQALFGSGGQAAYQLLARIWEALVATEHRQVTAHSSKVTAMTDNLVVSSKCGTVNHLIPSRPAADAIYGKCKVKMFAGAAIENLRV